MMDEIKKDITFYRKLLIPSLISKGDAGYKSKHIAQHIERFIQRVENALTLVPPPQKSDQDSVATPEFAEKLFGGQNERD